MVPVAPAAAACRRARSMRDGAGAGVVAGAWMTSALYRPSAARVSRRSGRAGGAARNSSLRRVVDVVLERARLHAVCAEPVDELPVRRDGGLRRADRAVHGHAPVRGVPEAAPVQRRALGQEVAHAHEQRVA
jgi:hypothetical protein